MTTPLDDDLLQRFYDGDLTPLEEHAVQAQIEADPHAQQRLLELGRMTDLVRRGATELSVPLDSGALFASITRQLAQRSRVPVRTRLRVRASEWLEHRRGMVVALGGAAALAATSLIFVLHAEPPSHDSGGLLLAPGEQRAPVVPIEPQAATAHVEETTPCEVLVVLGSHAGTGLDPALDALAPLREPPFDAFPRKALLQRTELTLRVGSESELALPNGRTLRVSWVERTTEGRLRLKLSIHTPEQRDDVPLMTVAAAAGDPFFVVGPEYEGGTLIVGVRAGSR